MSLSQPEGDVTGGRGSMLLVGTAVDANLQCF